MIEVIDKFLTKDGGISFLTYQEAAMFTDHESLIVVQNLHARCGNSMLSNLYLGNREFRAWIS